MPRLRAAWLAGILLVLATLDAAAAESRRVLLLHSSGRDFAPFSDFSGNFREELIEQSPDPINLYEVSLDTARFREPQDESPFVEYLRSLFSRRKLDLIVAMGGPAAQFLQRHRPRLFPTTPMLMAGVEQQNLDNAALTANDAVVAITLDLPGYIDNILRLLPETTSITVVIGASPLERYWLGEMRREFQRFAGRIKFEWSNELSFDETLDRASTLPPRSAIFYAMVAMDAEGVPYDQDRALTNLRAVANAPIFGAGDYGLGRGIVGGPLHSSPALGQRTAAVAVRILGGEVPGSIRTAPTAEADPVFDWAELQRWNISEASLPAGSEVRFRELTAWERYHWQVIAVATALLLQTALIIGLFYEYRRRRLAEAFARQSMSELTHMNRIATASELSTSIAHEINQPLGAIVANANAGARFLVRKPPDLDEVRDALRSIVDDGHRAGEVIGNVRAMFRKDRQGLELVDVNDLIRQTMTLLRSEFRSKGVTTRTELAEDLPRVSGNRVQLQQVILNLAMNGIEAMESVTERDRVLQIASRAHDPAGVEVTVEDSGTGIDAKNLDRIFDAFYTTKSHGMGMGLSICRSIIEAHGGSLSASPGRPSGLALRIVLPTAEGAATGKLAS
jgi:signal transduction histidine kinase